ncbi:MAG: hypothetical protein JG775_2745 [Defluviitaleaceae bacterium]|nr:hypothetical protein [Defluviitaleaceae bacterium]MDK2904920.1 hypothetical protein [Eubacteriaceae bacterium]
MKKIVIILAIFFCSKLSFSQNSLRLEILGGKKEGGKVFVSIFNSEQSYNARDVFYSLEVDSSDEIVSVPLTLPIGEYLFSVYQDNNSNGKLDTNFLGIPKELFGFSNYDGKGAPGDFNQHKIRINNSVKKITIRLIKI